MLGESTTTPFSEWPTYTANLCPIHCVRAASHSDGATTILHYEGGDWKRFF
jgi:hypothetical protein